MCFEENLQVLTTLFGDLEETCPSINRTSFTSNCLLYLRYGEVIYQIEASDEKYRDISKSIPGKRNEYTSTLSLVLLPCL